MSLGEENQTVRYYQTEEKSSRIQLPPNEDPTIRYSNSQVVSQLPSTGGEADISIIEIEGIKYIRKLYRFGINPKEQILKEVQRISTEFQNYFIIQHEYGYNTQEQRWFEIQEYAPYNSLREILSIGQLSEENIRIFLSQISSALAILHTNGIVHLDLKPANILIRSLRPFEPVIADFGISSLLDPEISKRLTELKGTFSYWAPEQISGIIGKECDYWALGVNLYECILGQNPFQNLSREIVVRELTTVGITVPDSIPEKYSQLLKGLLLKNPEHRWGGREIDLWLKGDTSIAIKEDQNIPSGRKLNSEYPFENKTYGSMQDLVTAFIENPVNWESSKKHLNRGHINLWLQKNEEFDFEVQVNDIRENFPNQDLQISLLIAKFCPELPFIYRTKIIDLNNLVILYGKFLKRECVEEESILCDAFLDGTLQSDYIAFCNIRKCTTDEILFEGLSIPGKLRKNRIPSFRFGDPIAVYLSSLLDLDENNGDRKNIDMYICKRLESILNAEKIDESLELIDIFENIIGRSENLSNIKEKIKNNHTIYMQKRHEELSKSALERIKEKKYEEAIELLEQAIKNDQLDDIAWYNKGIAHFRCERYNEAINSFNKVIEINPKNQKTWFNLGYSYVKIGNYKPAIEAFDESIKIDDNNAKVWFNKGFSLRELCRPEEAIIALDKALKINPNLKEAWTNKGSALNDLKKNEEAVKAYDTAIKIDPNYAEAWDWRSYALLCLNKPEDALNSAEKAIQINSSYANPWENKAQALLKIGKREESMKAFDRAIQIDPNFSRASNNKGDALLMLGSFEEANQAYDITIQIDPENADAWTRKAYALLMLGEFQDAVQGFDKGLQLDPNDGIAWSRKGAALFYLGRDEEAIQAIRKGILIESGDIDAWVTLGYALSRRKRYKESIQAFDKGIQLNSNFIAAWIGKGNALLELREYQEALSTLDKAIQLNPKHSRAHCYKGMVLDRMGEKKKAIQTYNTAIQLNPKDAFTWNAKGQALIPFGKGDIPFFCMGRFKEALEAFEKAIQLNPNYADAWEGKGKALDYMGRHEEMHRAKAMAKALKGEPISEW